MTLEDLKKRVDHVYGDGSNGKLIVGIPNNKYGMGGIPITNVKYAGQGIDWDHGVFFIWPENEMIEKPIK